MNMKDVVMEAYNLHEYANKQYGDMGRTLALFAKSLLEMRESIFNDLQYTKYCDRWEQDSFEFTPEEKGVKLRANYYAHGEADYDHIFIPWEWFEMNQKELLDAQERYVLQAREEYKARERAIKEANKLRAEERDKQEYERLKAKFEGK